MILYSWKYPERNGFRKLVSMFHDCTTLYPLFISIWLELLLSHLRNWRILLNSNPFSMGKLRTNGWFSFELTLLALTGFLRNKNTPNAWICMSLTHVYEVLIRAEDVLIQQKLVKMKVSIKMVMTPIPHPIERSRAVQACVARSLCQSPMPRLVPYWCLCARCPNLTLLQRCAFCARHSPVALSPSMRQTT